MSVGAPWRDEHGGTNSTSLTHFYQKSLAKNVRPPDDVITWPHMTFNGEMMQQRAGDIKHSLSGYNSGWVGQIWCALEVPHFFTIGWWWGGHEIDMTWGRRSKKKSEIYESWIPMFVLHTASFKAFGSLMCRWQALKLWTWGHVT